ncbi:MAG: serpin family protein [Planctomycetes bacterium]|nr:serpin family protein [Planctomycetota bacterium]
MRNTIALLSVLVVAVASCAPARAQKIDPDVKTLVDGNTDFGLALYQRLAAREGNLFFSPYSISNAFSMCYAGAKGNTAEQMKTTLRFNLGAEQLHSAFGKLVRHFADDGKKRPFQLAIANRLWGQKDHGFLPGFLKIGQDHYKAGLEEVDFVKGTENARQTINKWVEKQTKNKIKKLLPGGAVSVQTRLVLTNAIYFKAAWLAPFNAGNTKAGPFKLARGKIIQTPMMHSKHLTRLASFDSFSMVQIPYEGFQQSMFILLPKKADGLADLEGQLSAQNLAAWLKKLDDFEVDLKIPRFKVTDEFQLDKALKQMGMSDAFAPRKANFSGMASNQNLFISAALHKAFVEVNENGTEAVAATGIVFNLLGRPQTATFHADRPFFFLIRDHRSGSILFAGRVTNPAS